MKQQYNRRPIIGLFLDTLDTPFPSGLWPGIAAAARDHAADLICYCGGMVQHAPEDPWIRQPNYLYTIARENQLDGYIVLGTIGNYIPKKTYKTFLEQFTHKPVVTILPTVAEIPKVFVDSRNGFEELFLHLVRCHKYRKFGFIKGPENSIEAQTRFNLFKTLLHRHGLVFEPRSVFPGLFLRQSGVLAAHEVIKRGINIDVLVAANDGSALGAMETFQAYGIDVPGDIAVTGFDDISESAVSTPALTTIVQPLFEMGHSAFDTVMAMVKGNKVPRETILKTRLLVRQSCGCFPDAAIKQRPEALRTKRSALSRSMLVPLQPDLAVCCGQVRASRLIDSLYASITTRKKGSFLERLDWCLRHAIAHGVKPSRFEPFLAHAKALLGQCLKADHATNLDHILSNASNMVHHAVKRYLGLRLEQFTSYATEVRWAGEIISNALHPERLYSLMVKHLPAIGINDFFLFLYESGTGQKNKARLVCACVGGKPISAHNEGESATRQLVARYYGAADTPVAFIAHSLHFQKARFGFILFKEPSAYPLAFSTLAEHISSALHSSLLITKIQSQNRILHNTNTALHKAQKEKDLLLQQKEAALGQIHQELKVASTVLNRLLPKDFPNIQGVKFESYYLPSGHVGGDLYDVFQVAKNQIAILIYDVSGHGVPAALVSVMFKTLFQKHFNPRQTLKAQFSLLNQELRETMGEEPDLQLGSMMFVTVFYGLLDCEQRTLRYIGAGTPSPMLIKHKGIALLNTKGTPLGMFSEVNTKEYSVHLPRKAKLILFTDGLVEIFDANKKLYDKTKMFNLVNKNRHAALSDLFKQILNEHKRYRGDNPPRDDVTMLGIELQ